MRDFPGLGKLSLTLLVSGVLLGLGLLLPGESVAQRPKGAKKDAPGEAPEPRKRDATRKDAGKAVKPEEKNKPQPVDLETDDGVLIAATYFPSNMGKSAPAVILLHGYGEKQRIWYPSGDNDGLAFALQDNGYAVLTFDFRGHGRSTARVNQPGRAPETKVAASASKLDFHNLGHQNMPYQSLLGDIEAAKRFLVRRNNAGELNIAKLGVVGCEMGASMAILWSYQDWNVPEQIGFRGKQGHDVQALVLISPSYNFKGVTVRRELGEVQRMLPMMIIVGKKDPRDSAYIEASKMYEAARKSRQGGVDNQLKEYETKLQGSKLLNPDLDLDADKAIVRFLDSTLKAKAAKWEQREVGDNEAAGGN